MMHTLQNQKHIFSFYCPMLIKPSWSIGSMVRLDHQDLVHRLVKVVKICADDQFVLFDKQQHMLVQVLSVSKKEIQVRVLSVEGNNILQPKIIFLLPLLKKEALEHAIYSLCEIGVSQIQLVVTQKSRQALLPPAKEFERLRSIVVAAAEQSKNYSIPDLFEPKELLAINVGEAERLASKIVFDVSGESFFEMCLKKQEATCAVLLVGPEGGLINEELAWLKSQNFQVCKLTQTTLRAVQAVAVGAALFRLS